MNIWVLASVVGGALLAGGVVVALVLHAVRENYMADLAAEWETERAAMAAVLREDLRVLHARLAQLPAGSAADAALQEHDAAGQKRDTAAAHLREAERAAELFAANERWADNLRAATTAAGRAGRAMAGREEPPCLFSPVHGPAAAEVEWAPGGGARRRVPVCAEDAARLRAGEAPRVRTVQSDEGVVPYFAAHGRYVDWLLGWYDGFDPYLTARLLAGTPIGGHLPGRIRAIHGAGSDPMGEFGRVHD
ncbi:hypothetical protein Val02_54690 [Virgisporangium aliadipatigenens]|uniref:Uncharacterized protein n=1 Tax=Virgisporangium aliadipatigenens TaxID=741659 RepID=A0A8J4DT65_9ACTN|nr:hypothetical protein [Virgisporangium aliadipatigenens]GIJ48583.1 hypothetical protein Val02_54690 [Virgisporangium aliadipatigenens]